MKKNILSSILCLAMVAFFSLSAFAQDKIYLIKGNKIVATYGIDEVDYLTFEMPTNIETDDFEISIDEVTYRSVIWTVTPKDPEMYYYTNVYTAESLADRFENSVDKLASTLYNDMSFLAGMAGMDPTDFMESSVLYQGEAQVGYDQIGAGSEYVLVAFGCDPDGIATTETYTSLPFTTPAMEMTGLTVDFAIEGDTNDVTITTTPSDASIRYYVGVAEDGAEIDVQGEINNAIWRGSIMGKSPEQVIEELTVAGTFSQQYSLEPETQYVVYACSLTADGVVSSELSSRKFKTGAVAMSDNTFAITVDEIKTLGVRFTVKPSNDDQYTIGVLPVSTVEGMTDEEILDFYLSNYAFSADYYVGTEEFTFEWSGLEADTEYIAFAFGYYHNVITTPLTKVSFTTLPASDPKTWTATFGEVDVDMEDNTAYVQINVNQDDVLYLWNVVDASGTPEQIHEALLKECERYEGMGINYVEIRGIYGSNEVSFNPWGEDVTGKKYKFFAVVMNAETYEFETEVFFSDVFTLDGSDPAAMPAGKPANVPMKLLVDKKIEK